MPKHKKVTLSQSQVNIFGKPLQPNVGAEGAAIPSEHLSIIVENEDGTIFNNEKIPLLLTQRNTVASQNSSSWHAWGSYLAGLTAGGLTLLVSSICVMERNAAQEDIPTAWTQIGEGVLVTSGSAIVGALVGAGFRYFSSPKQQSITSQEALEKPVTSAASSLSLRSF
jgi:hypothetical protein